MEQEGFELLLSEGEGFNLEFKESLSDSIARDICAFANASGGKILIGVSDAGKIKGIEITNRLKSQIQDYARNIVPHLTLHLENIGNVMAVTVPEGKSKPYSAGGRFYLRQGANSQQLDRDEVRDLFINEGHIRFESILNMEFEIESDIDSEQFSIFLNKAKISSFIQKEKLFESLELAEKGRMKNAGILLFCKKVTSFFPTAIISCAAYQGKSKYKIIDKKDFDSGLYSNYENAIRYLKLALNTEYIIKGGGPREERLELPEKALREALLNAIAHKDYFTGSPIHIDIFKDRVEITNPGGLIGKLKVSDLYGRSIQRNPLLFGLMQRMELAERAGSGLIRINNVMEAYKLPEPRINADKNWFSISFKRPDLQDTSYEDRNAPINEPINEPIKLTITQKRIFEEIKEAPSLTYKEIASIIHKSRITVMRNIGILKNKKLIKRIGPNKGGHWEIAE